MRPTLAEGIRGAIFRAARAAGAQVHVSELPVNRAQARKYTRGAGPWMRFKYVEVKNFDGTTGRVVRRVRD